jgi:hypothetical protein
MHAVIFKAEFLDLDDQKDITLYHELVDRLHKLAFEKYGCLDLTCVQEGRREITISYWESREQIARWKNDPEHKEAQDLGRMRFYRAYTVEVVEIDRQYSFPEPQEGTE